ncbi:hypothetical protein AB0368_15880 [Actinoplanes sp. NPDC051475]|uniref:hypothetical protein n=1 Tax=Actinoplanes sp. NPDC051475 TaxID=3157225 RepID=UPI0034510940
MPVNSGDDVYLGALLSEYERIKEEQRHRIGFRDNLIYVTLASMAAAVTAALNSKDQANLLLLLPPVCFILGWTYLVNDEKISAAGRYIREEVRPKLVKLDGTRRPVLGWEDYHRSDQRRGLRKYLQLIVDLSTFCISGYAAITVYFVNGPLRPPFVLVGIIECVALSVLAFQIAVYADVASPSTRAR